MIERAIRELNEKRGSNEDAISRFLVKEYDNLPWAHPAVLKHHLGTLCRSGDIVCTNKKRYRLPGQTEVPIINSQSTKKVERKPPRSKKRLKWDWERVKKKRLNRKPALKLKINLRGKKIEAIAESQEHNEKEERVTEENVGNVASIPDVDLNSQQQTVVGPPEIIEPGASCTPTHEHPGLHKPVDLNYRQQTEKNFNSQQQGIRSSEIMGSDGHQPELEKPSDLNSRQKTDKNFDSQQHRIGQLEIIGPDASSACTDVQPELQNPEDSNSQQQAIGMPEITDPSASDAARLENMSDLGLARAGPMSSEELLISDRARRQQRRWSMCQRERKSLVVMTSMELVTCQNEEENFSLDSSQLSMQKDHESKVKSNGENGSSALTDEQPELQKPEDLNSQQLAIGPPEITEPEATVCMQSKHIRPDIRDPLGPEPARFEYPTNLGPVLADSIASEELVDSERARRQQRRWNMSRPPKKATFTELAISQNPDENHSLSSNLVSMLEQKDHENNVKSNRGEKNSRKRKRKPGQPKSIETQCDLLTLPISTNQEAPAQQEAVFQKEPRRSLRLRLAQPEVNYEANVVLALPSQDLGEKVEEGLFEPLNKMPVNGLDEETILMSLTDKTLTSAVSSINCTGLGGVPKHRGRGRLTRLNAGLTQAA
ncbi:winged-helix DNA-binding transcription factor family protein [Striga hermonthica]|uniref:Winged-helix DNA-binding transcription factor family protein n=1 Tax=Striga hermonthica TaxID=68872 RepID=A0A9N7NN05_STRHE|nr:winged-helix DNA-binding transcription factor family protein [Striga hermonthica]